MKRSTFPSATLAEGTRIFLNGRTGNVYRSTAAGVELIWEEFVDPQTGEVHPRIADALTTEVIGKHLKANRLLIVELPANLSPVAQPGPVAEAPRPAELKRAAWRECHVLAAQKLIEEGRLAPKRASFVANIDEIVALGMQEEMRRSRGAASKRAGQPLVVSNPPKSGEAIFGWWRNFKKQGSKALVDHYRWSGNRQPRFFGEVASLTREVIEVRLTEERPSISSVVASVRSRVRIENKMRMKEDPNAEQLPIPGYDAIWNMIALIAPLDHAIRTEGMDRAYRALHTLGAGLKISRPLERVEIDEYVIDLEVFLRLTKLDQFLTPGEKIALGLTSTPERLILSAAIDVYTGAIVAFQISTLGNQLNVTLRTIEMIYLEKQDFAEASGAAMPWPMSGHPQTIAFDRGSVYLSDELYLRLSMAGITNLAVPAGKPFLKPWIERFFRTTEQKLLNRFTGRTFSNVVLKGDNDPKARATLSLDDFLYWMTRWIVDVYHTEQPETLDRSSPLIMWERAVAEMPPAALVNEKQLRRTFGDRYERKLTRAGVEVCGLHYQADRLAEWFLTQPNHDVEVWWWHAKIGRVDVRLPDDTWVTAHCTAEEWTDASYDDLSAHVALRRAERQEGQDAQDEAIVQIDADTAWRAKLRGLLPVSPTPEQMPSRAKEFRQFMNVPGERPYFEPGDIFDDVVTPHDEGVSNSTPVSQTPNQSGMEGDFLE